MTQPIKKTYVEFVYPGSFMNEYSSQEVKSRDAEVELPKGAFAYRFFDHETVKVGNKTFTGDRSNVSGLTYVDGEVLSVEDVKKSVPNSRTLVSNMEGNGWDYVVKTKRGNFQPLEKGDSVTQDGKAIYPDPKAFPPSQKQRG